MNSEFQIILEQEIENEESGTSTRCLCGKLTPRPTKADHIRFTLNLGDEGWVLDVLATGDNRFLFADSWKPELGEATLEKVIASIPAIVKRIPL